MLVEIERFVNWLRRRNPQARTWRDYRYDLRQFVAIVGDHIQGKGCGHAIRDLGHAVIDAVVNRRNGDAAIANR